ncbi:MBL fold metallo-hydrolase [Actinomadura citrea]|uniref:Glyoxylase-like metal-dependent hydrolase (Beta-lactamase superfamily II) n=1 Tax=Actinomadura citrea TaxID=46158 RepID=A0A7Y9GIA7_9ACTN|nr:MBL fold metallo-hydrolase [Actinomadura citrea]NYE15875.1 glyoxylase-like metal-dependent hydrolase (beta-lactamase superfamily II) [Actinomadura citrea]GGT67733.1 MBL fold hydrolase [Actinomadura citrea]
MTNSVVDQAERLRRPAGIRSLPLGDMRVSYVPDGAVRLPPRGWLPDTTEEVWITHPDYLDASGHLVASIGGLLVEHGDRALLIDAGFGPQSLPPDPSTPRGDIHGGALLESLAELGRGPEEIEAVAFTHLHSDHLGWAWHPAPGSDRPVFAHADYLVSESEWAERDVMAEEVTAMASRVRTVTEGEEIFPGVRVRITAGHTAGHAEYVVTSGGQRLIAFGDALHSPIQIDHPEWSASVDHDPARSADHRRRLVAELEEPGTIGFGVHFADVVFGRVRRDGDGPAWRPVDADASPAAWHRP